MFIRARTKEQFNERKQDIISATEALYKKYSFREITFTKISKQTKIARSTIYNYYLNKEEIFLDIIEKHFLSIEKEFRENLTIVKLSKEELVEKITQILLNNYELLVLLSYYIEQIEYVCSQEKLNEFKLNIKSLATTIRTFVMFQFPNTSEKICQFFIQAFYSSLFGIVPVCSPIKKQVIAMKNAGTYVDFDKKEFISFYFNNLLTSLCN